VISWLNFLAMAFDTFTAWSITSGPIPSPAKSAIFSFINMLLGLTPALSKGEGVVEACLFILASPRPSPKERELWKRVFYSCLTLALSKREGDLEAFANFISPQRRGVLILATKYLLLYIIFSIFCVALIAQTV